MFNFVVILVIYLLTVVESNDVSLGHATPFSRKIYGAIKEANPALWKRRDDIMVNAPYNDFISAVYVTDLRSDKEGEAYVVAGGIGQKTVTIALKSPSILTGYKFAIEVYAESMHAYTGGFRASYGGLSGVGAYAGAYPSGGYPMGNVPYPAATYPIGR